MQSEHLHRGHGMKQHFRCDHRTRQTRAHPRTLRPVFAARLHCKKLSVSQRGFSLCSNCKGTTQYGITTFPGICNKPEMRAGRGPHLIALSRALYCHVNVRMLLCDSQRVAHKKSTRSCLRKEDTGGATTNNHAVCTLSMGSVHVAWATASAPAEAFAPVLSRIKCMV